MAPDPKFLSQEEAARFWQASFTSRLFLALFLVGLTLIANPLGLHAQEVEAGQGSTEPAQEVTIDADYDHESAPRARAVRVQTSIDVDGRLDEPVWAEAPAMTEFIQEDPAEGEPGTERTEFRVVYDDDAIYIGAMLYDRSPITTRLQRRDAGAGDFDFITVSLDSYHDHETVYLFGVNPSGSFHDAVSSSGGGGGFGDSSWDPVWDVATRISEAGWSAEMRIPFSQLRFSPAEGRPFFVEGGDIFRVGEGGPAGSTGRAPQLFYSRRIGRSHGQRELRARRSGRDPTYTALVHPIFSASRRRPSDPRSE